MSAVLAPTDIREQAAQRFEQLGWPTPRLEEWKFTNLAPCSAKNGTVPRQECLGHK